MLICVPGHCRVTDSTRTRLPAHGLARQSRSLRAARLLLTAHGLTRHALGARHARLPPRLPRCAQWALRPPERPPARGALGPTRTTLAARHTLLISVPGDRRVAHGTRAGLAAHGLTRHSRGLGATLGARLAAHGLAAHGCRLWSCLCPRRLAGDGALVPGLTRLARHTRLAGLPLGRLPHGHTRLGGSTRTLHH